MAREHFNVLYKEKYSYGASYGVKTYKFLCTLVIVMWYISLKFQDRNFFLNLWKLTHELCVQRNRGLSKNGFNIEISIKTLGYSVKFNVRKKKKKKDENQWALEYFCRGWTWKKNWRTAMADSQKSASIEKMCLMKRDFLWSWRYDWERCFRKVKGVSRSYILTVSYTHLTLPTNREV